MIGETIRPPLRRAVSSRAECSPPEAIPRPKNERVRELPSRDFTVPGRTNIVSQRCERAGLNPKDCWLHKFRATYATTLLQSGVDLRTVQSYLGHSDMESTARYLKPARNSATVVKLNGIWKN